MLVVFKGEYPVPKTVPGIQQVLNKCLLNDQICKIESKCFPGGPDGKAYAYNKVDPGSIPGSGRSPLEKGMAAHSNILAWRIPWMEEPGGLQSMGSQRVGYN